MSTAGATAVPGTPSVLRDLITLTKPRIIVLLLITTVCAMFAAQQGVPGGWLILWTVIGGYLSAGGANTINQYVDRDIDAVMGRTDRRPIVTGRIAPGVALAYGLGLVVASGGCPLLGPLGISVGAPSAASFRLAIPLTGRLSGLMGRRGSSHGQHQYWSHCVSRGRPAATGELTPRCRLAKVRPWTRMQMAGPEPAQGALAPRWARFRALNSGDHGPCSRPHPHLVLSAAPASC